MNTWHETGNLFYMSENSFSKDEAIKRFYNQLQPLPLLHLATEKLIYSCLSVEVIGVRCFRGDLRRIGLKSVG